MPEKIVNLTHQIVVKQVEDVLEQYPDHPYQRAFANPELRQRLIVYVLNQCQNYFTVINACEPQLEAEILELSPQPDVKPLIHQGIRSVIQENSDWVYHHIPAHMVADRSSLNWFR